MARRFYEPVNGDLQLWSDPNIFVEAELQEQLDIIEEYRALSYEAREELAPRLNYTSVEEFDDDLDDQRERLSNLLDFFNYEDDSLTITIKDGAWFTPIAVQAVCGEEVDHEAILSIDGFNNTYWEHRTDEAHEITWQLRDYNKRIAGLEVRLGNNIRTQLTNLDVYVSKKISGLTKPENLVATGVNLTTPDAWNQISFSHKAMGKYIRFTGFGSVHSGNVVRIQEVRAWVVTIEYN